MYSTVLKMMLVTVLVLAMPAKTKAADYAYYGLEPDIVTNYLGNSASLGYVRMSIELLLEDVSYIEAAEHHAPLLRATIIEIIGRQSEERVKSLTGREDIRRTCLNEMRELLQKETGSPVIKDVIFTKYLYQG